MAGSSFNILFLMTLAPAAGKFWGLVFTTELFKPAQRIVGYEGKIKRQIPFIKIMPL